MQAYTQRRVRHDGPAYAKAARRMTPPRNTRRGRKSCASASKKNTGWRSRASRHRARRRHVRHVPRDDVERAAPAAFRFAFARTRRNRWCARWTRRSFTPAGGVRTLAASQSAVQSDGVSQRLGLAAHDNAICARGLSRYGGKAAAVRKAAGGAVSGSGQFRHASAGAVLRIPRAGAASRRLLTRSRVCRRRGRPARRS